MGTIQTFDYKGPREPWEPSEATACVAKGKIAGETDTLPVIHMQEPTKVKIRDSYLPGGGKTNDRCGRNPRTTVNNNLRNPRGVDQKV